MALPIDKALTITTREDQEIVVKSDTDGLHLVEVTIFDLELADRKLTKKKSVNFVIATETAEALADSLREIAAHERAQEVALQTSPF